MKQLKITIILFVMFALGVLWQTLSAATPDKLSERALGKGSETGNEYYIVTIDGVEYIVVNKFYNTSGSIAVIKK